MFFTLCYIQLFKLFIDKIKNMETKKILTLIKTLEKYPLEVVLVKHLIIEGIDTEEKLIELLKTDNVISQPIKVKLQNYFRDVERGLYDINKIPLLFK
jgi:hypothetical protein